MNQPALRADDTSLAERCAQGDRAAQKELFQRTRAAVHRTLYRVLGSNAELEDLLQETYLAVFRSIASYGGRSSVLTWCCSIAAHTALSHLRRRRPVPIAVPETPSLAPGADRVLRARVAVQHLYAALDRIDPVQRVAFTLAVVDGRPLAEVAELTGASLSAVKTQVWRARAALDKRAAANAVLAEYIEDLGRGAEGEGA